MKKRVKNVAWLWIALAGFGCAETMPEGGAGSDAGAYEEPENRNITVHYRLEQQGHLNASVIGGGTITEHRSGNGVAFGVSASFPAQSIAPLEYWMDLTDTVLVLSTNVHVHNEDGSTDSTDAHIDDVRLGDISGPTGGTVHVAFLAGANGVDRVRIESPDPAAWRTFDLHPEHIPPSY